MSAANDLGESAGRIVTPGRRPGTSAKERKRQQRARDRGALLFERQDWQLFLDSATLPQKAGCQPAQLRAITLREPTDNALDVGADATIERDGDTWIITDNGPGLDPADVPRLFAVNRPLLSSKRRRLPLRGMLGNGLRVLTGAVAASEGSLIVETRGHRLTLAVDMATGLTRVENDQAVPVKPGVAVHITFGPRLPRYYGDESTLARNAIAIASYGKGYDGPSSPWWYSSRDLHLLMQQVTPDNTTVGRLCRELGFDVQDDRIARTLSREDAAVILAQLRKDNRPVDPKDLGSIGPELFRLRCYACHTGTAHIGGADIPYVVEAWADCHRSQQRGEGTVNVDLYLNRTPSLANILVSSYASGFGMQGCGIHRGIDGPKTGNYNVHLSVIAPYIELATDGKEPSLHPFSEAIATVLRKACRAAHRAMDKPPDRISIKDAAWDVMADAYRVASGGVGLANARQVMYQARPKILAMTGQDELNDKYFTQVLLPDFIDAHPELTADWDIIFDDRGAFVEPHTGRVVPLGTLEVRQYIGERPPERTPASIKRELLASTNGPTNRYLHIVFIEKEGFSALLARAQIAERFDVAIMSTKGMSVVAARWLLDRLAPHIKSVLVLHDFDVAGFSIFGTLRKSGRRYRFDNDVPIIDIGLRLADIDELGLRDGAEPVPVPLDSTWEKREITLAEHGATDDEINFLYSRRVELNAMPAPMFIDFIERKLTEHGLRKVIPTDDSVLEQHARYVIEQEFLTNELEKIRERVEADAAAVALPSDMRKRVEKLLQRLPAMPWDLAVAEIARRVIDGGVVP